MRRRTVIGAIGSIGAGAIGLSLLPEETNAATIQLGEISIPDASKNANTEISDVKVKVNTLYEYQSNYNPHRLNIELQVGSRPDQMYTIDSVEETDGLPQSETGEQTLMGSIPSSGAYSISDFNPSEGQVSNMNVLIGVVLNIYRNANSIATATADTVTNIEMKNEELTANSSIGGEGQILVNRTT